MTKTQTAATSQAPDAETHHDAEVLEMLESETGGRHPVGFVGRHFMWLIPLAWSLFQLYHASPLSLLNSDTARAVHLCFAISLAFVAYPAYKGAPANRIPLYDWALAIFAVAGVAYVLIFSDELARRAGAYTTVDLVFSGIGLVLLLEATRRALGPPLAVVASVFLLYSLFGAYMPDVIAHAGASLNKLLGHQWLTTEGVFGVALGVSTDFVFLFVLFGALLERAGAGNYFIRMAFSMLGHMRGGPAKAAVVASGLSGIISGSSIANVVTTGTFTIPLMKKVGFPATKAGAVEVAASTNGQLTPPIMGAAAFLMVEYVGIPYLDVIKHALLPALISYIALIYIVHLEACKAGMEGLKRTQKTSMIATLLTFLTVFIGMGILTLVVYYGIGWIKTLAGDGAAWIVLPLLLASYVALIAYSARFPELGEGDIDELPPVGPTVKVGLYFLLPVVVLVWCLTVERMSPGLSAFWAVLFMIFITVTQRPLVAIFRKEGNVGGAAQRGGEDLFHGLVIGAKNMIGIGVATAAAGIVVGTVTLTGLGLKMTAFVEFISAGNLMLILLFTAVISLILGMGLPTTANYIVVSTLMAPVIVNLGAENGLIVPLIAVHLFVFYFGILADDTPPVGLAAFAAAAIAKADPIKTGIQGFTYDIRTAILPFMFIFNTNLLLMNIDSYWHLAITVASAVAAMLVFAAATQGYWLTRTRWYETIGLLLITFTLFRPGYWWDMIYPPTTMAAPQQIETLIAEAPVDSKLPIHVSGINLDGDEVSKTVLLPVSDAESGEARLTDVGLTLDISDEQVLVSMIEYGSVAQQAGIDFDFTIDGIQQTAERPPKEIAMLPALALLWLIGFLQVRRRRQQPAVA
ncbi:TRAP transporter permease [Cobetia sp. cqz5-12]|uniref:TRAP transporter permease n=1 Tax=Cobetia sp. cqz5-12 TaxID=2609415 RepID=UPI001905B1DD|nr:TRAP transporter permease [Cobetia sp. cqz5-12]QQK64229.1 TRAP transporter permease [Cobetia sp. cqz5-12]